MLPAILPLDETEKRNIADLADLMWTEARGAGEAAMIAVAWALRNRMLRNKTRRVDETWHGFSHGEKPTGRDRFKVEMLAQSILDGSRPDPTHGATHFYSPVTMPKEGASKTERAGFDLTDELESVPGVMESGKAVRDYPPSWAAGFREESVNGVPKATFRFFRSDNVNVRVR